MPFQLWYRHAKKNFVEDELLSSKEEKVLLLNQCDWSSCITPEDIGILHNTLLDEVDKQMTSFDTATLEMASTAEAEILEDYLNTNPVCGYSSSNVDIDSTVLAVNYYYNSNRELDGSFNVKNNVLLLVDSLENVLNQFSIADTFLTIKEQDFVHKILDSLKTLETMDQQYRYGNLADNLLYDWQNENFDTCQNQGYLSKTVIMVMKNSDNYFNSYTDNKVNSGTNNRIFGLPVWVGLDALGALAGGLGTIVGCKLHEQAINWGNVGAQALIWGAGNSMTGLRWFKKFFNR